MTQLFCLPPIKPNGNLRFFERHYTTANGGGQADLYLILFTRLSDRLKREVAAVDDGAAESERDQMIQFVLIAALDRFTSARQQIDLDGFHGADIRPGGSSPAGLTDRRANCGLLHIRVKRQIIGKSRRRH